VNENTVLVAINAFRNQRYQKGRPRRHLGGKTSALPAVPVVGSAANAPASILKTSIYGKALDTGFTSMARRSAPVVRRGCKQRCGDAYT
jgi:hypothetical protein